MFCGIAQMLAGGLWRSSTNIRFGDKLIENFFLVSEKQSRSNGLACSSTAAHAVRGEVDHEHRAGSIDGRRSPLASGRSIDRRSLLQFVATR